MRGLDTEDRRRFLFSRKQFTIEIQKIVWAINGARLCAYISGPKTTKIAPYGLYSGIGLS
jgi:hypothetical protein